MSFDNSIYAQFKTKSEWIGWCVVHARQTSSTVNCNREIIISYDCIAHRKTLRSHTDVKAKLFHACQLY